jgi:hypothetical protein
MDLCKQCDIITADTAPSLAPRRIAQAMRTEDHPMARRIVFLEDVSGERQMTSKSGLRAGPPAKPRECDLKPKISAYLVVCQVVLQC